MSTVIRTLFLLVPEEHKGWVHHPSYWHKLGVELVLRVNFCRNSAKNRLRCVKIFLVLTTLVLRFRPIVTLNVFLYYKMGFKKVAPKQVSFKIFELMPKTNTVEVSTFLMQVCLKYTVSLTVCSSTTWTILPISAI